MILFGALFQLAFAVLFFFMCIAFFTGAPFVPSGGKTSAKMVELASIKNTDVVYDLGSGDGRLLLLANKYGAKKIIGLEINPMLVLFTKLRMLFLRKKNIQVLWKNFWTTSLKDADVVFVYLLPWKMDALAAKLKNDLKPGALIVSNSFIFPGWKIVAEDPHTHVYVFTI